MIRIKKIALATLAGGTILGGGCLGGLPWQQILWDGAADVAWDWVLDNDAVVDLFEDGAPPA